MVRTMTGVGVQRYRWCIEALAPTSPEVAEPLAIGDTWVMSPWRGEISAREAWAGVELEEQARLMTQLGQALRRIHDSTLTHRHGEVQRGLGTSFLSWNTLMTRRLERARALFSAQEASPLVDAARRATERLYRELAAFHPRTRAVMVHGVTLERVLVQASEGVMELTSLVGFERALLGPWELDFGRLLWFEPVVGREALLDAFYEGYDMARTMDIRRREEVYRTLTALEVAEGLTSGEAELERRCRAYLEMGA
ncbi:MAG: hypothetical protein CMH57_06885 [Myxococcales bacterium]|nr:hypothetical protein [Myxococcales bacterium]